MSPLLGKHNWRCCYSQPNPRGSKSYFLQNPQSCLLNHKDKIWSMRHIFVSTYHFPPIFNILLIRSTYYFIVFFLGLCHLWSSFSLALHKETFPDFGEYASCTTWVLTQHLSPSVISPYGLANNLSKATWVMFPLSMLIIQ